MKPRKWTIELLRDAVPRSRSIRQVLQYLGLKPAGGNYQQIHHCIDELGLDTSHFLGRGWNIEGKYLNRNKIPIKKLLVQGSHYQSYKLKLRLITEGIKPNKCEECGWSAQSKDGRIPLELHHRNGDRKDNRLINLEILCPNCHSLKPNHRALNIANY